jgi:hypothetical protein
MSTIFANAGDVDIDGGVDVDVGVDGGGGGVVVGSCDDIANMIMIMQTSGFVIHPFTRFAVQTNTNAHLYRLIL